MYCRPKEIGPKTKKPFYVKLRGKLCFLVSGLIFCHDVNELKYLELTKTDD